MASDAAQVVLPARPFDETLAFFTTRLGFRVDAIFPADAPNVTVVSGHGLTIRLDRDALGAPGVLRLVRETGGEPLIAPNGTRIEIVAADPPVVVPPLAPRLVVNRAADGAHWGVGRAGMRYRDLLPDRLGGRFIASHIAIPEGGPVPDYVHFHKIRFQMIYCRKGWVRVVYEDQGAPFVMRAGDCVLQPPRIRHRVLESSPGLEVIEIGCPALHETLADHALVLPNGRVDPMRDFDGQRFLRHEASTAPRLAWRFDGFVARDIGMRDATRGLADVHAVQSSGAIATPRWRHDGEFYFVVLLEGAAKLETDGAPAAPLVAGDSFAVPAGTAHALTACSGDLEFLEVTLPAGLKPR